MHVNTRIEYTCTQYVELFRFMCAPSMHVRLCVQRVRALEFVRRAFIKVRELQCECVSASVPNVWIR